MPGPVSDQYKGPKGHMPFVPTWMENGDKVLALRAALAWCVENEGECLGDHPKRLASYKELIA